jgi:hypothetical protein
MDLCGDIAFSGKEKEFSKSPLALFGRCEIGRNAELLKTLIYEKSW